MGNFKEVIRIAGAFVGVIVGAGFASGQELMQFFTSFGLIGLAGSMISIALFIFLAMALSSLGQQYTSSSHKPIVYAICGKYLGIFVDALITFFMFALAVVMIAGGGALGEQLFGIPKLWGSVAVTVLTVLIVCMNVRQVITFIGAATPLLALMVIIVSVVAFSGHEADLHALEAAASTLPRGAGNWVIGALLYVSYNIIAGAPFLIIMGGQSLDRKTAVWGGVLGGVLLGLLMLMIVGSMFARADILAGVPMPMLLLATQFSPFVGIVMGVAIFGMILNTAVGVLYSFSARLLEPGTMKFRLGTVAAGILAFAGSLAGFVQLVGTVFPFFGYLGFVLMICTLVGWLRLRSGTLRLIEAA
ncbi:putative membrane protein YkvI [Pseudaminobacter salicylatoxidans]|uniref:Putative membrane protein YkvI n=1 Tax=Pseudaminobacter salicylatoxidans TaxID=93369 RepID=A0A316C9F1_PSESE|nr:hypothetical protein [Pseudaminobacter salicylatoxidans]PWJ86442.1 putative membrane protein YkvI [Pseudaminobacter salicylatoxidans]